MSILQFSGLPEEYEGIELSTDFRNMINVEMLMHDETLSTFRRNLLMLEQLYPTIPANAETAIRGLLWFFSCGKNDGDGDGESQGGGTHKRSFDFEQDADHIYASFAAAYGIRLAEIEHMHWWEFLTLFHGLPEETTMKKIIYYRTVDVSKLSKHERKHALEMKNAFALKSRTTKALEHMTIEEINRKTQEYYDKRMKGAGIM